VKTGSGRKRKGLGKKEKERTAHSKEKRSTQHRVEGERGNRGLLLDLLSIFWASWPE